MCVGAVNANGLGYETMAVPHAPDCPLWGYIASAESYYLAAPAMKVETI
jgi:hypothetical protein